MTFWGLFQFSFVLLSLCSGSYYAYTHFVNIQAWKKLLRLNKKAENSELTTPTIFFSVLVPARNEAANINQCLESIFNQDYPKSNFEVFLIDDHSTDNTVEIASSKFGAALKIIKLGGSDAIGKKAAITQGIKVAGGNWIATTDADCEVPISWLKDLATRAQSDQAVFVGGPVLFKSEKSDVLSKFQQLDLIGMMGVTAGGIQRGAAYLANGAHLAYSKKAFEKVDGFQGVNEKASGDDMLLLQKLVHQFPDRIAYAINENNAVKTAPETSWMDLYRQRLRWASKGNSFPNFATWLQMVLVFIFSGCLIMSILLLPFNWKFGMAALIIFAIKFTADFFYLRFLCNYFKNEDLISSIWWASIIHACYIFVIGTAAQFVRKYEWKGRSIN